MPRGWPNNLKPQPEWMRTAKVGDVLRSPSGLLRVVRKVTRHYHDPSRLACLTFAIKHCSWTKRPYTVIGATELRTLGYTKVGANYKLNSKIDAKLFLNINNPDVRTMHCCDARDLP